MRAMGRLTEKIKEFWVGGEKKSARDVFATACDEVRRCKVSIKGRPRKGQRTDGYFGITCYFSPLEVDAIRELAREENLSQNKTVRTVIRAFMTIPVDED